MAMPLDGIRVLDWTTGQNGPIATSMLGDLGADVIKIEQPVVGDPGRGMQSIMGRSVSQLPEGRNYFFEHNNHNKRGMTLNLKKIEGKKVLYRMVEKSDIFVQNTRKGVAERLGVDYATLCQYNPRLVYVWSSSLGPEGPESWKPGVDYIAQGRSGIMTSAGEPDMPPLFHVSGFADQMGAIMTAYASLAGLIARDRLGIGQEVDASLLGAMIMLQSLNVSARTILGAEFGKYYRKSAGNPLWNHYQCSDGRWIVLAMVWADRCWPDFCKVLGIQELRDNPKFENMNRRKENAEEFISILDGIFRKKTRDEWMKIMDKAAQEGADIMYGIVNTISDLPNDPQVLANEYISHFQHPVFGDTQVVGIPFKLTKTPGSIRREAPELGQHTEEVLLEFGYTWDDITKLKDEGVI